MPYVICDPCKGVKDKACQKTCPVSCIYEAEDQLFINPDECIECGVCVTVCPVSAIFHEDNVPTEWQRYIEVNRSMCNDFLHKTKDI